MRKKVIARHVGVLLLLNNFFYDFGKGRDDGDGAIVGYFGRIAGFVDLLNNGELPSCRKITGCEAGVDNEDEDVTDGIETKLEDPDGSPCCVSRRLRLRRKRVWSEETGVRWDLGKRHRHPLWVAYREDMGLQLQLEDLPHKVLI